MTSPLVKAVQEATAGLQPLLDGLEDREGLPKGTSPSHLRAMAAEILRRDDLPADKLRGWLGYVQGVLVAQGHLDMDDERQRTRPIFHMAYLAEGTPVPPTVAVGEARGAGTESGWTMRDMAPDRYGQADAMAEAALKDFVRWTGNGFMDGYFHLFVGESRHDYPEPPSVAMLKAVTGCIGDGSPDGEELKARMDFMDRLMAAAREREKRAVGGKYRASSFGQTAWLLSALAVLAGTVAVAMRSEFLACSLLVAAGTAYAGGSVLAARRGRRLLRAAWKPAPPESYIPWLGKGV